MDLNKFSEELMSIHNPDDRGQYLSNLINMRTDRIYKKYKESSEKVILDLKNDLKDRSIKEVFSLCKSISNSHSRILMILDEISKI